jgi:hypothetical protein
MNTAEYVENLIITQKNNGVPLSDVAWNAALACVGWPYVFGDRGQYCTPSNRRAAYNRTAEGKNKDNIKAKCKNFSGDESCSGCKWFPDGKRVRDFDCRGFTYWILLQVFGWKLMGAGCTTQWNNKSNWKAQGEISDGIPQGVIVCVFYFKKEKGKRTKTVEHTGLYYNGQTVECSAGVQHSTTLNKKWDVWGIPACVEGDVPTPTPTPPTPTPTPTDRPTLRKGSKGEWVTVLQTKLAMLGYDLGSCGIDGDYGRATVAAVREFQKDVGLSADGICGPLTWSALDNTPKMTLYTVTIPHVTLGKARELAEQYIGATYVAEE